jgi:hypothetical protein
MDAEMLNKFFLYKEKYLEFLFVIPFPIFGFWNAMVPFNCIKSMLPPLPFFKVNICEREGEGRGRSTVPTEQHALRSVVSKNSKLTNENVQNN